MIDHPLAALCAERTSNKDQSELHRLNGMDIANPLLDLFTLHPPAGADPWAVTIHELQTAIEIVRREVVAARLLIPVDFIDMFMMGDFITRDRVRAVCRVVYPDHRIAANGQLLFRPTARSRRPR